MSRANNASNPHGEVEKVEGEADDTKTKISVINSSTDMQQYLGNVEVPESTVGELKICNTISMSGV